MAKAVKSGRGNLFPAVVYHICNDSGFCRKQAWTWYYYIFAENVLNIQRLAGYTARRCILHITPRSVDIYPSPSRPSRDGVCFWRPFRLLAEESVLMPTHFFFFVSYFFKLVCIFILFHFSFLFFVPFYFCHDAASIARLHQTRTGFLTPTYTSNYLTTDGQLKLTAVFPSVDNLPLITIFYKNIRWVFVYIANAFFY